MKTETPTPLTEAAERVAAFEAKLRTASYAVALKAAYGDPRSRRPLRVDALCADLRSLLAERAALAEERGRLAGALEPFAKLASRVIYLADNEKVWLHTSQGTFNQPPEDDITANDFRRARSARLEALQ